VQSTIYGSREYLSLTAVRGHYFTEAFGQRHLITVDPNGILIDVIQGIPPTGDYGAHYATATLSEMTAVPLVD
jgi:hypothetical protein